jgi:hypothetical protein
MELQPIVKIVKKAIASLKERGLSPKDVVQVLKKSLAPCECSAKRSTMAESPIRPIDKGTGAVLHSVLTSAKRNGLNEFELSIGERYWIVFRM